MKYEVDRISRKAHHVCDTLEIRAGILCLAQRANGHFTLPLWLRNNIRKVNTHITTQVVPDRFASFIAHDVRLASEISIHRQWITHLSAQMTHATQLSISVRLFSCPNGIEDGPHYGALLHRSLSDMMTIRGLEKVEIRKEINPVSGNTSPPSLSWTVQKGWQAPDKQAA